MNTNPWIAVYDALPFDLVNRARVVANDERFHLGRHELSVPLDLGGAFGIDELGPVFEPVVSEIPAPDSLARFTLDVNCKIGCAGLAIHHVLEMALACFAAFCELLTLIAIHFRKKSLEVHGVNTKPFGFVLSTPNGFALLLYLAYE